ncbi:hypothetical protein BGX29_009277 [Mortierella sp. GBA35]|nr:hypothetical protein BGX29_009277 [Mortierella sp. GBA35]
MEDRTDMDGLTPGSASESHSAPAFGQMRTPGESSSNPDDNFGRTMQESVAEDTRRTVPGLPSSPTMSSSSASASTDGPTSARLVATPRTSTSRYHQDQSLANNEPRTRTPLSPSPSLHFPSLSLGSSSSDSPRTQLTVSPSADNAGAASSAQRRWSNSNMNPSGGEPATQLGQEGFYSKRDLEELYKSWRSNFEEKGGSKALPSQPPQHQQQHQNQQDHRDQQYQHPSRQKLAALLAGGGKDVVEDGRDPLYPEMRKVKWKAVEFSAQKEGFLGGSQGRQRQEGSSSSSGGAGGEDRGGGHGGHATATTKKRDLSKGPGDKRAQEAGGPEARRPKGTSSEDQNKDQDSGAQDGDKNADEDEEGYLSEADGSSGDPGLSVRAKKSSANSTSATTPGGHPRRVRLQENKSHQCDKCSKRFSRPSQLLTHSFTHSGEKPHQCPHCKRLFNVASNLKRHIRIHSNSKRRSSRNGSVVFRSFAQGTHVTQMVSGAVGGGVASLSKPAPSDQSRILAPASRSNSFDRLRWMSTETPLSGLTASQQQQRVLQITSYRPIKSKTSNVIPGPLTKSPSSTAATTPATSSPTTTTTTTGAPTAGTPATPMTPATPVTPVTPSTSTTPSSGSRNSGSVSSGQESASTSGTTVTSASSLSTDADESSNKPDPMRTKSLPALPLALSLLPPLPPPSSSPPS